MEPLKQTLKASSAHDLSKWLGYTILLILINTEIQTWSAALWLPGGPCSSLQIHQEEVLIYVYRLRGNQQVIVLRYSHICSNGSSCCFGWVDEHISIQRRMHSELMWPVCRPHLDVLSIKSWDITWFVAFAAYSRTWTLLGAYFVFSCADDTSSLFFFSTSSSISLKLSSSYVPPVCLSCVSVLAEECVSSQIEKRREEGLWNLRVPVVAALLPSFLSLSLSL